MDVYSGGKKTVSAPLKRLAATGAKWTGLSAVISAIVQFLQVLILARYLKPEDFGLMAMATVVLGLVQAYGDLGITAAIVQRQDIGRRQLSSLYWLNIFSGIILFLLVWASSPLIASFFHEPRLRKITEVVSLNLLIVPFGLQFQTLLQKNLHFDVLARQEITTSVFGLIISSLFAVWGYGVWALVFGQLSASITKACLLVHKGRGEWLPMLCFKFQDLKGYLSFGLYQMGERTINYFNTRFDQLLIGALLGPVVLGYYSFAFNLVVQPISRINPVITTVAFPLFAKIQNEEMRLKSGYLSILKILSMINFPILMALFIVSPTFVPSVFGSQWHPAITLVQILSFVALIRSTGNPVGSLLLARGRADLGFKWNVALLIAHIPCIYLGSTLGGATGVCISLLILQVVFFCLGYSILIRSLIGPCLTQYMMSMIPAFVLSGIMILPASLVPLIGKGIQTQWQIVGQILSSLITYCVLNWAFRKKQILEIRDMILHD